MSCACSVEGVNLRIVAPVDSDVSSICVQRTRDESTPMAVKVKSVECTRVLKLIDSSG